MTKSKKTKALRSAYQPSDAEQGALDNLQNRRDGRSAVPALRMDYNEDTRTSYLDFDHEDQRIANALAMYHVGTADIQFFNGLLKQVAGLTEPGQATSEVAANFALSAIRSIEPRNEVEAMLAAQMAATHQLTMQTARRMALSTSLEGRDSAERAFNKLARTYAAQMDALKRYRAKAQQTVRVERVTVNEGGQAVVGDVSYRRGDGDEK